MKKPTDLKKSKPQEYQRKLAEWNIHLAGCWTEGEVKRVFQIFQSLSTLVGGSNLPMLFNYQTTTIHHSQRSGRVGRTSNDDIFLDEDWTYWTFAHELGHRWNNAWSRQPEEILRDAFGAGKWEWLKLSLRRLEKLFRKILERLGFKCRLDWQALWYHPGQAPPPCGVDRNFNASEDLAETFAAAIFPKDAIQRARNASNRNKKLKRSSISWDWGETYHEFHSSPRGKLILSLLRELTSEENALQQANHSPSEDQPGSANPKK